MQVNNNENNAMNSTLGLGTSSNGSGSPLAALFGSTNLITSSHSATEVADVSKYLQEKVKELLANTAPEIQKATLPRFMQQLTSDITPHLPGIAMYTVLGTSCYVMPILFYKAGITDATDTIQMGNEAPRGYAKTPTSFMTNDVMKKVKESFKVIDGKTMTNVVITAPMVMNLERYIKAGITGEDMAAKVGHKLLKEWQTGITNMAALETQKAGGQLPNPFAGGKLFGQHEAALARVESVHQLVVDGLPVPYNLAVKLATANKNNMTNYGNNTAKTILTSYLNVQLETMSPGQFNDVRARNPGRPCGPIVPVVVAGMSNPGETLHHNNSLMTQLLGLFASLAANAPVFFSEAFRGQQVGNRGNLGVFNNYMASILGPVYGADHNLTNKNITNIAVTNDWIQRYVAPQAVYAIDLIGYVDETSNNDFWFGITSGDKSSTYVRSMISLCDLLTGGKFSALAKENTEKGANRDKSKEWAFGDAIMHRTNIIRPYGIAKKGNAWFDLGEVDGMFLRQPEYYGTNEVAINEYNALLQGSMGNIDTRIRQYNILNRLQAMFNNDVIVEGWSLRYVFNQSFFNTLAQAMSAAGTLSVSGNNAAANWTMHVQNEILNMTMGASLSNAPVTQNVMNNVMYTQF